MEASAWHIPVLLEQSIELLGVGPGGRYCDATIGGGGHAREILARSAPDGRVLGIDRDPAAIERCQEELPSERLTLERGNFAGVLEILGRAGWEAVDGIIADLGVSSHQLESAGRGFSFALDGPLDMRMGPDAEQTADELIRRSGVDELANVIYEYGEERASRRIARAIKQAQRERRLPSSTSGLAALVARAHGGRRGKIHPATRTFQALRIAVNDELGALRRFLGTVFDALRPGGRVVVISFHSLEDREVKRRFASLARPDEGSAPIATLLTKKPLRASSSEVGANPRARSARLRAAERL